MVSLTFYTTVFPSYGLIPFHVHFVRLLSTGLRVSDGRLNRSLGLHIEVVNPGPTLLAAGARISSSPAVDHPGVWPFLEFRGI